MLKNIHQKSVDTGLYLKKKTKKNGTISLSTFEYLPYLLQYMSPHSTQGSPGFTKKPKIFLWVSGRDFLLMVGLGFLNQRLQD